jgi:hypothetical protein
MKKYQPKNSSFSIFYGDKKIEDEHTFKGMEKDDTKKV